MQKYADDIFVLDSDNNTVPLSGATVKVYEASTTTLSSIFSDNGVTPISNPLTVGEDGSFEFYANNGRYDILVEKSPYKPHHENDILLNDCADTIIDEDTMISDLTTKVPTQQSVKAYVDSLFILKQVVTLSNIRLSLVNGIAFIDIGVASLMTSLLGCKIIVFDSAGKKAVGYIKAAGSGETYLDLVGGTDPTLRNGDFSAGDTTWTKGSGWSIADSKATCDGTNGAVLYQNLSLVTGGLYKTVYSITARTAGAVRIEVGGTGVGISRNTIGEFTQYLNRSSVDSNRPILRSNLSIGFNGSIDSVTVKQVLTPSATGVTITSTPGGTTYNWALIESGFNYNDSGNYTVFVCPTIQ